MLSCVNGGHFQGQIRGKQSLFSIVSMETPSIFFVRAYSARDVVTLILLGRRASNYHSRARASSVFSGFECCCEWLHLQGQIRGKLRGFSIMSKNSIFSRLRLRRSLSRHSHFVGEAPEKRLAHLQLWGIFVNGGH